MNNLSEHVSYVEATKSITAKRLGIDNTPDNDQLNRMITLSQKVFEPLRKGLGNRPINISIFFRCPSLNKEIPGASPNSQHMALNGAAMDIDNECMEGGPTNSEIYSYIKDNLIFDQLIWEKGTDLEPDWVHVSYNEGKNRKQLIKT